MPAFPPRQRFVHGPTPLWRVPRLSDRMGIDLWIKRDDANGGAEAGNKLRKLEFLVADALDRGATTLVTGGHVQSNHARTTAIVAAWCGLRCQLCLWSVEVCAKVPTTGNALLMALCGAEVDLVGDVPPSGRDAVLARAAASVERRGQRPYVIPEGGSNGLGALGYVQACREIRRQLDAGLAGREPFDVIVHACGSGGTTAGLAAAAGHFGIAKEVHAVAVVPDAPALRHAVGRIIGQVNLLLPDLGPSVPWTIDPRGVASSEPMRKHQRRFWAQMARYGLILDPVYTGRAMWGMSRAIRDDGRWIGKRVLFLHTGGFPGLLVPEIGT